MIATPSLSSSLSAARREGRVALIAYVVAGDPDMETTERVIDALSDAGVDVIELGIPYSDPLADGPVIATAAHRALQAGTTIDSVIHLTARATSRGCAPILYFTYTNPIFQFGIARFVEKIMVSAAAGAIVPDLPLEESSDLRAALKGAGRVMPLLVAPTTSNDRARAIAEQSTGFVYVVSRAGVTGEGRPDLSPSAQRVADIRSVSALPIGVGFGIASALHVEAVASFADAAIVGTALMQSFAGWRGAEAARRASAFIRSLRAGAIAPLRPMTPASGLDSYREATSSFGSSRPG